MADQDFDINIRTRADLSGIEQTKAGLTGVDRWIAAQNAAKATGGAAPAGDATQSADVIGRLIGRLGAGFLIYGFIDAIKEAATHIQKITDELDKQGAQLVENAQKYGEAARFAQTESDIIKIGEAASKDVESTHKRVLELSQQELNIWEKIINAIGTYGRGIPGLGAGPLEDALKLQQAQAAQQEEIARQSRTYDVQTAKIHEARRAAQSYSEQIEEITDRIKEQKELADTHWQQGDIDSYLAVTKVIENYKKELQDAIREQERFRANLQKTGAPDVAGKLTPGGEFGHLQQQLGQLGGLKNLTPIEEKTARDAYIATEKELRDKQIQAEKDARDAQIKAQRDRYEGTTLPGRTPGESQSQYNSELLQAIRQLTDAWK